MRKFIRETLICGALLLLLVALPIIFAISPVMRLVNRIWPPKSDSDWKQFTDHRPYQ